MRKLDRPDLTELDLHLQDIYAELRYLVHMLEGIAQSFKKLIPEE